MVFARRQYQPRYLSFFARLSHNSFRKTRRRRRKKAVLSQLGSHHDEASLVRFTDWFNAVILYQRSLMAAIDDLPDIPILRSDTWTPLDRARWYWGAYAGREMELVKLSGLDVQSLRELVCFAFREKNHFCFSNPKSGKRPLTRVCIKIGICRLCFAIRLADRRPCSTFWGSRRRG